MTTLGSIEITIPRLVVAQAIESEFQRIKAKHCSCPLPWDGPSPRPVCPTCNVADYWRRDHFEPWRRDYIAGETQ